VRDIGVDGKNYIKIDLQLTECENVGWSPLILYSSVMDSRERSIVLSVGKFLDYLNSYNLLKGHFESDVSYIVH
jgi:hypothetical protein